MKKLLFICKKRTTHYGHLKSSGLLNSARMVVDALCDIGIKSKLVDVIDGNCIDREVHSFKPTHVILEAFWCPPYKLKELVKLHPKVKWTVRNHSKIPFLAGEGISFKWAKEYSEIGENYILTSNSSEAVKDFNLIDIPCGFTPNIYNDIKLHDDHKNHTLIFEILHEIEHFITGTSHHEIKHHSNKRKINISCFGAIRPFKNQLLQAMAAIHYANSKNKILKFHMNAERVEMGGEQVLKNIKNLFDGSKHSLIEHPWMDRPDFLELIQKMDLGLQASITETFNIVTADFVKCGVPFVASADIDWAPDYTIADPHSITSILERIEHVMSMDKKEIQHDAIHKILKYNRQALNEWINFLNLF
jgi:hypothetical protein